MRFPFVVREFGGVRGDLWPGVDQHGHFGLDGGCKILRQSFLREDCQGVKHNERRREVKVSSSGEDGLSIAMPRHSRERGERCTWTPQSLHTAHRLRLPKRHRRPRVEGCLCSAGSPPSTPQLLRRERCRRVHLLTCGSSRRLLQEKSSWRCSGQPRSRPKMKPARKMSRLRRLCRPPAPDRRRRDENAFAVRARIPSRTVWLR